MSISFRVTLALVLSGLSFTASAEVFKCKQPDGSYEYRDHGCTVVQQSVKVTQFPNGGTVLTDMLAETFLTGLRSGVSQLEMRGRVKPLSSVCLMSLDKSILYPMFNDILNRALTNTEISSANTFFNSAGGKKFAIAVKAQAYKMSNGLKPNLPPSLSAAETKQITNFADSSAGEKILKSNLLLNQDSMHEIVTRITEVNKSCSR